MTKGSRNLLIVSMVLGWVLPTVVLYTYVGFNMGTIDEWVGSLVLLAFTVSPYVIFAYFLRKRQSHELALCIAAGLLVVSSAALHGLAIVAGQTDALSLAALIWSPLLGALAMWLGYGIGRLIEGRK